MKGDADPSAHGPGDANPAAPDRAVPDRLEKLDRGLARVEAFMVVFDLFVMVSLSALQLVLRKVFDFGFEWADILTRQMVLWLGFTGGALATHEARHIAIDALSKFLPARAAASVRALTSIASVGIALVLSYAALQFLASEMETGSKLVAEIPAWPFEVIIPASFLAITFHFLVACRSAVQVARGKRAPATEGEGAT